MLYRLIFFFGVASTMVNCAPDKPKETHTSDSTIISYKENYRPRFHFTPAKNWMNDPNGLLFHKGEYHMFYQYNPLGNTWGHMSWGHAVSKDLLHWDHLPVAIEEYVDHRGDSTMVFSGSAVVDKKNSTGFFGQDSTGLVAIYTSHVYQGFDQIKQHQSLAYSKDGGRTFTRYENNPVLDINLKDFRDPKVFWYEPENKWVMAVVVPNKFQTQFYSSQDLKQWKFLSSLGPLGDTTKIWECPDLVQLSVINEPEKKKWALIISASHPQRKNFVGMQYFVGDFDGQSFIPDNPGQYPLYLDYGKDFYAGITFNNMPKTDGRNILIGWANNWAYAQTIPTHPWRSAMALPREIALNKTPQGYRINQKPIQELDTLRESKIEDISAFNLSENAAIEIEYEFTGGDAKQFGLKIFKGTNEETVIAYDRGSKMVSFQRNRSGNTTFHPDFGSIESAPAELIDGKLKLHVFIDHSIVEVFINDGESVITNQVFPTKNPSSIELFSIHGEANTTVSMWTLKSIW